MEDGGGSREDSDVSVAHPVLSSYYKHVLSLSDYLAACHVGRRQQEENDALQENQDEDDLAAFLSGTRVAWNNESTGSPRLLDYVEPQESVRDHLERVQLEVLQLEADAARSARAVPPVASTRPPGGPSLWKPQASGNIIASGYALSLGNTLVAKRINSSITEMVLNPVWHDLLVRAGSAIFLHLLKHTSLFVSLRSECYRQVSGVPIYDLMPLAVAGVKRKAEGPNIKDGTAPSKAQAHQRIPLAASDELLPRSAIFYATLGKTKAASSGVSFTNVLNSVFESFPPTTSSSYTRDLAPARHLSKHIWRDEYGLDLACLQRSEPHHRRHLVETAIMDKGPTGTPKRLQAVLPLLKDMTVRHKELDYRALRDKICPSTFHKKEFSPEEKALLLEVIAEDIPPPLTQAELSAGSITASDINSAEQSLELLRLSNLASQHALRGRTQHSGSSGHSRASHLAKEKERERDKEKPRFIEFTMTHYQVTRFVQVCIAQVLPPELLGSQKNAKCLDAFIERFVSARRYETFSVHRLMQGITLSDCVWLDPTGKHGATGKKTRATPTESAKKRALMESFLRWLVEDYVVDLLRTNFYITESGALYRRTLYFLQSDWLAICQPLLDNMAGTHFRKMEQDEAARVLGKPGRKLAFSHVRLLPKEQGVRPIVNLSHKPANDSRYSRSINQILSDAFAILGYERQRRAELAGAAVQASSQVYAQLKAFKSRIKTLTGDLPRIYMVKLDIRTCFDSIKQDKLFDILKGVLSEREYAISRYVAVVKNRAYPLRQFEREVRAKDDHVDFPEFAFQLAGVLRKAVFVDQVKTQRPESREEVLRLLKEHVEENVVKIGSEFYKQVVGIPQGSILSTLLCNFFYADLEKAELDFIDGDQNLLLRLVDDFLLLTTDRSVAEQFLRKMHAGHPEYGCFVSTNKTLINFDLSIDGVQAVKRVQAKEGFPWCGYLLHQKLLEVRYDYSRFSSNHLGNNLTVKTHKKPGETFITAMMHAFKLRSHLIFYDMDLNSAQTAYVNVYQSFQMIAMKFHAYLKVWRPQIARNPMFFLNAIHRIVHYAFLAIRSWFDFDVAREHKASHSGFRKSHVTWLGYRAFWLVLSRKPTAYGVILNHLRQLCRARETTGTKRQLQPVLSDPSNGLLRTIRF